MPKQKETTKGELLQDLRKTSEKVEGKVSYQDHMKHGEHSPATAQQRFGSWNKAKEAAGLKKTKQGGGYRGKIAETREIIEKLNQGKTLKETAEELDYSGNSHLSNRLRREGIKIRNKLTEMKSKVSTSLILTVKEDDVREAGLNPDDEVYFEKEVGDGEITLKLYENRVAKEK